MKVCEGVAALPAGRRRGEVYAALELELFLMMPAAMDRLREMLADGDWTKNVKAMREMRGLLQWLRHERETEAKLRLLGGVVDRFELTVTLREQTLAGKAEAERRSLESGERRVVLELLEEIEKAAEKVG